MTEMTLTYDPFQLPTALHRAGLAGLIVLVDSMKRRRLGPVPEVVELEDFRWKVSFSQETLTSLFNELYDACLVEVKSATKRAKEEPKRIDTETDPKSGKEAKRFVYDAIVPKCAFLEGFGCPEIWIKLWRDAMFGVIRKIPATRNPYQDRLARRDVAESAKVWISLGAFARAAQRGDLRTESVSGALYLGAMEKSAEAVSFAGRADENFLLHFWPVVTGIYQLEAVDREGKRDYVGYAVAVPDVDDVEGFTVDFEESLARLDATPAPSKYRPRDAVISVPQEGGLEYLRQVARLVHGRAIEGERRFSVSGVDVYFLESLTKGVRLRGTHRVGVSQRVLDGYDAIRRRYGTPQFRRQLILNLLRERPWYLGFDALFVTTSSEHFVGKYSRWFAHDARSHFDLIVKERSTSL
jgi:CRISPR-associated protein Cmx8